LKEKISEGQEVEDRRRRSWKDKKLKIQDPDVLSKNYKNIIGLVSIWTNMMQHCRLSCKIHTTSHSGRGGDWKGWGRNIKPCGFFLGLA
jgi:hypothetical protein